MNLEDRIKTKKIVPSNEPPLENEICIYKKLLNNFNNGRGSSTVEDSSCIKKFCQNCSGYSPDCKCYSPIPHNLKPE